MVVVSVLYGFHRLSSQVSLLGLRRVWALAGCLSSASFFLAWFLAKNSDREICTLHTHSRGWEREWDGPGTKQRFG